MAVMHGRRELHRDGLPLMPQHGAQPSLSPPHRGGPCAVSHEANSLRFTTGYTERQLLNGSSWWWEGGRSGEEGRREVVGVGVVVVVRTLS